MRFTKHQLKTMFLDYFNNFLSIERFAEHYELGVNEAQWVINTGRDFHESDVLNYELVKGLEESVRLIATAENNNAFKDCALPLIGQRTIPKLEALISRAKNEN